MMYSCHQRWMGLTSVPLTHVERRALHWWKVPEFNISQQADKTLSSVNHLVVNAPQFPVLHERMRFGGFLECVKAFELIHIIYKEVPNVSQRGMALPCGTKGTKQDLEALA